MTPLTRAEASGYQETSLHADVMRFLGELAARRDPRLVLTDFGRSPGGRELPLVVVSADGVRTPAQARARGLPVVLIINGIHAGEVEGKEASLMLLRELLGGGARDLLEHLVLVVVPLFNPDGNDALDPANRKLDLDRLEGQLGPPRVGTRVNQSGINLNRDYMLQAAPEMRLLQARVAQVWDPDLTIDTHTTNGSVHRYNMTVDIPHTVASGPRAPIDFMRARFVPELFRTLAKDHGVLAGWYGNFIEDERALDARAKADPRAKVAEGWMTYPHQPRFGSNYRGLRGGLDLLLECYSYQTFAERVHTMSATLHEALRFVAGHREAVREAASGRAPPERVAVRYRLGAFPTPIEVLTREPRTLEGAPASVRIPHFADFVGTAVVARPPAYLVTPGVAAQLALHGLGSEEPPAELEVEVATATGVGAEAGRKILEDAQVGALAVSWTRGVRRPPPGARLVRTDRPGGAVAVYLCEPESDDGAVENSLCPAPALGAEFPLWRAYP